jgi:hypothetical protein
MLGLLQAETEYAISKCLPLRGSLPLLVLSYLSILYFKSETGVIGLQRLPLHQHKHTLYPQSWPF